MSIDICYFASQLQYGSYLVLWQTNSQAGERRKVEYPASSVETTDWLNTKFLRIMQFRHHPAQCCVEGITVIYRDSAPQQPKTQLDYGARAALWS
jgi:hypothetical protein